MVEQFDRLDDAVVGGGRDDEIRPQSFDRLMMERMAGGGTRGAHGTRQQ